MLVDTGASHSFMSPQMVKSLGLFSRRVDNPIEVRLLRANLKWRGEWWGMWRLSAGRRNGKKVLPSTRWTTSMSSWA